jgi:hypothetical protein
MLLKVRAVALSTLPHLTWRLVRRGKKGKFSLKVLLPKYVQKPYQEAYAPQSRAKSGISAIWISLNTDDERLAESRASAELVRVQQFVNALIDRSAPTHKLGELFRYLDAWKAYDDRRDAEDVLWRTTGARSMDVNTLLARRQEMLSGLRDFLSGRADGFDYRLLHRYEIDFDAPLDTGYSDGFDPRYPPEDILNLFAKSLNWPSDWEEKVKRWPCVPAHRGYPAVVDWELIKIGVDPHDPNYMVIHELIRREWLSRTLARLSQFEFNPWRWRAGAPMDRGAAPTSFNCAGSSG